MKQKQKVLNKQELIEEIKNLPKFERRKAHIEDENGKVVEDILHKGIVEKGHISPLCYVCNNYNLIQFEDILLPFINKLEDIEGNILYWNGSVIMDVFPTGFEGNNDFKYGIVCMDSVNTELAIHILFCIKTKEATITIPKSVKGLKRIHVGKALEITTNYIDLLGNVQEIWQNIVNHFGKYMITNDNVKEICQALVIRGTSRKRLEAEVNLESNISLWDVFIKELQQITSRKYKSELNRRKRIDKLSKKVFDYAFALGL